MELNLENFERDRTDANLEWWTFNVNNRDFFITINKENLSNVLDWKELKTELYWRWEWLSLRELEKRVKKELTICLISDDERRENLTEALPIDNRRESEKVRIKISERLLNELLDYEWRAFANDYEYRYDTWWNKMHFYVTDSFERDQLKDNIDLIRKVYNLTYPNDKNN